MFGATEYSKDVRLAYVEEFRTSGMSQSAFAKEKDIPPSTFRGWLKEFEEHLNFGEVDLRNQNSFENLRTGIKKTLLFSGENIRIELKEGYNKEFLRNIIEVLINAN